ncbi:MAG: hypothetical protein C0459_09740 [Chitinophaga sp.]|jgi:Lipid A 3-O-deacylase (PagL)|nr:hypothetical protein [Chitinophaga sp.]
MKKLAFLLVIIPFVTNAQNSLLPINKTNWQQSIGIIGYTGNVVVHTQSVKSVEGAKPSGFSIDFAKLMNDEGSYQLSSAYPQKGFSFSYFNYGTKILGEGYIASYFIQPNYRINNRLHVQLKGAVGLGYLTNPFDSINNPTNKNYSQYVTPYLQLGIGLGYRLSQHFTVSLATNFHHLSNGSNHQPNSGLNYTTTALSINYFPNTNELKKYGTIPRVFYRKLKPTLDIGLLYVPEQGYNYKLQAERQYTFGLFAQLTKQIGRTSALSIGAEAYHNEFENITNAEIKTNPYLFAGIYGGHEFIIGKIIFSQQIGFYITPHSSYFSDSFKRFGLRYKMSKHFQVGFNLKVHDDEADFIDYRIIYRL